LAGPNSELLRRRSSVRASPRHLDRSPQAHVEAANANACGAFDNEGVRVFGPRESLQVNIPRSRRKIDPVDVIDVLEPSERRRDVRPSRLVMIAFPQRSEWIQAGIRRVIAGTEETDCAIPE